MARTPLTELEEIIINLNIAVERGELTQQEAVELLDAFQDHEYESYQERYVSDAVLSKAAKVSGRLR